MKQLTSVSANYCHSALVSHISLSIERAAADTEQTGRATLVSSGQPQDALDVVLLERAQVRDISFALRRRLLDRSARVREPLQVFSAYGAPLGKGGRSFEEVFELPDV